MPSGQSSVSPLNSYFRTRLVLLGVAIVAIASFTFWGVQNSWQRIRLLEQRLTRASLESFRLAGQFQGSLLTLNNSMLRGATHGDAAAWQEFETAATQLDHWIDEQSPRLHTEHERQLFSELNQVYDDYLNAARQVRLSPSPADAPAGRRAELEVFEQQAQRLLRLGTQLAEAHRDAEESFLAAANASLGHLRIFLFVNLALLLGLTGVLGWFIYRDLIAPLRTRLVRSQVVLERQEKLATLGTLAAGIAHEIRNPLTSIKARLYTLAKHIKGNDAGLEDAKLIGNEITRLERIVQEVLQFARPSEPQFSVVRADAPLREVQRLMAVTLEKQGIALALESHTDRQASLDLSLIKQVLINLVRNGAEAIAQGGAVTLRARAGRLKLNEHDQEVVILEVADTGKGIPPEVEKRLFDPFFSTKEGGTGLGLSIVARIVEKHGGVLQYQTCVGRGTTFGIVLPAAPVAGTSPPPA